MPSEPREVWRSVARALFRARGYTPIPLVLLVLAGARVTWRSALVGGVLVLAGEALRVWGVSHAGSATRTREVGAPRLVTSGPYGFTRNPLYVGNLLMTAGFVCAANAWMPWSLVVVVCAFGLQYGFIVRLEEERLRELFGATYDAYRAAVPRFGVRWPRYADGSRDAGDVGAALLSERRTFQTTAALVAALTLRAMWARWRPS